MEDGTYLSIVVHLEGDELSDFEDWECSVEDLNLFIYFLIFKTIKFHSLNFHEFLVSISGS